MEETKDKKKNSLTIIMLILITLLFAILETVFAYFGAFYPSKNQNVKNGILKVGVVSSSISQTNILPIQESEIKTINDKLNNENVIKMPINVNTADTNIDAYFDIYLNAIGLENKEYINGSPTDIKWELLNENNDIIGNGTFTNTVSDLKLNNSTININKDKTSYKYTLLIYIIDTNVVQNDLQNIILNASIKVIAKQK